VLLVATLFLVWLGYFAGSQISREAAQFPRIVAEQATRLVAWLDSRGFAIDQGNVQNVAGQLATGVGTVTKARDAMGAGHGSLGGGR
jgi:hypothetical protein